MSSGPALAVASRAPADPDGRSPDLRADLDAVLGPVPPDADGCAVWRALGTGGLLDRFYAPGRPGHRIDPDALATTLSTLDAARPPGVTLSVLVQASTAVPLLAEFAAGSPPATEALKRVLSGAATVALAATDAGAGSDLTALATTVESGADGVLTVSGTKRWITGATRADHLLVLARQRPGRHFTCFSWVLVPAGAPGVTVTAADTDLFGGSGVGHVELDRVRLPGARLLGRTGLGLPLFARRMATERLAGALWAVALCRRVIADTRARLLRRHVADAPLWHSDAVRQRLARCLTEVVKLDALCRVLGPAAVDSDGAAGALLKAAVGPTVEVVLAECAQLQGADGFAVGGAQRLRAEAAVFGIGGGTTEVVLGVVADHVDAILRRIDR
ncbi:MULTISPECIES: acyl-CoA dehydrogenase [unclassified Micromonospora]|uniref:acyl-CoA dehydrogenase family protein n=1 Tax=unclassified Micromonospora TaxID=2617518 RepID=UPI002415CACE|nr:MULTISPECIES: acyl-CoA dehydrogenase [unclassified Micromonospora]MDG4820141.1 acyl-CoA dehydrogenase [Micromonospora sp. WMMD956]WFE56553.1 acyl-CoA dehydrogenase [Micromonospora sp. WMMD712]